MTVTSAPPRSARTLADRVARLVLPPLDSFGDRGTVVAPLGIVLVMALLTAGATQLWGWNLASGEVGALPQTLHPLVWMIAALTPLLSILRAGVLTLVAWALAVLVGSSSARLRPLFSAFLYGEAILSLQGPVLMLILLLQGGPRAHGVPVPTGLDILVDPSHHALFAVAHEITPFNVMWVLFLAHAVARSCSASRRQGFAIAGTLWAAAVGLAVLRATLGGNIA